MAKLIPSGWESGWRRLLSAPCAWQLLTAAVTALLSFIMLFVPWISGLVSVNAFGEGMQAAGPALIIVMVVAITGLIYCALSLESTYASLALIPASALLVIYIVKLGDVGDLIDFNEEFVGVGVGSIGIGLWLGFLFALATLIILVAAVTLIRKREAGQISPQSVVQSASEPERRGPPSGDAPPGTPGNPSQPPKS
ncbi:hypothetical protein ACFW9M_04485 [Streptomyces lydicus]|uniref:hypothetical protein n=1 Tax=Streptomyces lydicus TaxID=47763 RepID=UPI0036AAFFBD